MTTDWNTRSQSAPTTLEQAKEWHDLEVKEILSLRTRVALLESDVHEAQARDRDAARAGRLSTALDDQVAQTEGARVALGHAEARAQYLEEELRGARIDNTRLGARVLDGLDAVGTLRTQRDAARLAVAEAVGHLDSVIRAAHHDSGCARVRTVLAPHRLPCDCGMAPVIDEARAWLAGRGGGT
jgi:hypothetical protein